MVEILLTARAILILLEKNPSNAKENDKNG